MRKNTPATKADKAGIAMIIFGLLICGLSIFFHQYWLLIPGGIWITLPLFFTKENDDEDIE